jgi:hypothetical protein
LRIWVTFAKTPLTPKFLSPPYASIPHERKLKEFCSLLTKDLAVMIPSSFGPSSGDRFEAVLFASRQDVLQCRVQKKVAASLGLHAVIKNQP